MKAFRGEDAALTTVLCCFQHPLVSQFAFVAILDAAVAVAFVVRGDSIDITGHHLGLIFIAE